MSQMVEIISNPSEQSSATRSLPKEVSICAVCKDDISTNLGRRRLLFHLDDSMRSDPTSQVVKQVHDLMSLFANGAEGRQCDLSNCSQEFVGSMSAKWCCRKCERMVDNIYKKFEQLQQFYNQYRECPLSRLLHSLSVDNSPQTDPISDQTITIHGVIIPESDVSEEFSQISIVTNPTEDCNQTETQLTEKSPKRKKSLEDNIDSETDECRTQPNGDNQRETRSKAQLRQTNGSPKSNKRLKIEKNSENDSTKRDNQCKSDLILSEMKSQTDKQIVSSLLSQYYEGVMRALLSDETTKSVAIREVARFVWKECSEVGTQVAKLSNSLNTLRIPELKRLIQTSLPSTLLLFSVMVGKEKSVSAPIVTMISILLYALNSHANLFQKIVSTVLLHSKCNSSTIERLHSYKVCIAYETLVSFLDRNTQSTKIQKMVKDFQL